VLGLGHAPTLANAITIHAALCGSIDGSTVPAIPIPVRPVRHDRDCPVGCHAACAGRRGIGGGQDGDVTGEDVDGLGL